MLLFDDYKSKSRTIVLYKPYVGFMLLRFQKALFA
jgi:hypothetical protein